MNSKWKKILTHRYFSVGIIFLIFYLGSRFSSSPLEISFCHLISVKLSTTVLNVISEFSLNAGILLIFYCLLDVNRRYTTLLELCDELESQYWEFNSQLISYIGRALKKEENCEDSEALQLANKINADLLIFTTHKYDYFNKTSTNLKSKIRTILSDTNVSVFLEAKTVINTINRILELDFISNENKNNLLQIKKNLDLLAPGGFLGPLFLEKYIFSNDKHLILEDTIFEVIKELKNIHSIQ